MMWMATIITNYKKICLKFRCNKLRQKLLFFFSFFLFKIKHCRKYIRDKLLPIVFRSVVSKTWRDTPEDMQVSFKIF